MTERLYYADAFRTRFDARVIERAEDGCRVYLDQSAFYPTSGGQVHDTGHINRSRVIDVFKQGTVIIHVVDAINDLKEGETVHGRIDMDRRIQLAQHHTATHILNGAARKILGEHIWQCGAAKMPEKARLDITHYENLTEEQIKAIEDEANRVIKENLPIYKSFMKRNLAESKYGFRLYQGGAVPGKELRIVDIMGFDVEACGGTHLDITGDVGQLKIIRTSKIQDGVVRIEFTAGLAAEKTQEEAHGSLVDIAGILRCEPSQIPGRTTELFEQWKKIVKKGSKEPFELTSTEEMKESNDKILAKTALILKTQPEHVLKTIERFLKEIYEKQNASKHPTKA